MKNLKHILRQLKNILKIGVIAILLLSTVACDKDNEPGLQTTTFKPNTPQGNNLKLTYPDGKIEYINGDSVIGWGKGNLLGGNYWKQVMGGSSARQFVIRINIPTQTKKNEIIGVELDLASGNRLYLQNSTDIPLRPELWIKGEGFNENINAYGKIKIIEEGNYDIIGEITAEVLDINGKAVKITGFFWKQNADPYSG